MKVGIIIGSVRDERAGHMIGEWVHSIAAQRDDADYVLMDLKDFALPVFCSATHPMRAGKRYDDASVQAWSDAVDACDAFVFVTPEYNHGVPGGFKNAVDSLGPEFVGKPVGFVGYGSVGAVRAIEQWRPIMANFSAPTVRGEVNLSTFRDLADGQVTASEGKVDNLTTMLDQLVALTAKLA